MFSPSPSTNVIQYKVIKYVRISLVTTCFWRLLGTEACPGAMICRLLHWSCDYSELLKRHVKTIWQKDPLDGLQVINFGKSKIFLIVRFGGIHAHKYSRGGDPYNGNLKDSWLKQQEETIPVYQNNSSTSQTLAKCPPLLLKCMRKSPDPDYFLK